jgi:ATP-binding cassette, subfamily C, bacterial
VYWREVWRIMARQSGFKIMRRLIVELKPLTKFMLLTIMLGVLGFISAISIAAFGAIAIADKLNQGVGISFSAAAAIMIISAVLRGPLRYGEQLCGHYIAFKILVVLRDKVFSALRKLAPAKLEGREKGNLVSLITSDIEMLEVFYAHTIAPISIAVITNTAIALLLYNIHPLFGIVSALFYFIVGFCIPYFTSRIGKAAGMEYREEVAGANSYLLDSLRGLKEIFIYNNGNIRAENINKLSKTLNEKQSAIKHHEAMVRAVTDLTILLAIFSALLLGANLVQAGEISFGSMLIALVVIASSFGPVVALSNLSNNLLQTFASAQRLFDLLDEEPEIREVLGECDLKHLDIQYHNVAFSYKGREEVLKNVDIKIKQGEKIALVGESGSGKSTFAKLLMRFWYCGEGKISLGDVSLKVMPTRTLRNNEVLMSQETYLFNETIEDNIKVGNRSASREEVMEAAKKASIHHFIMTLPSGYDTKVGELGSRLSSGERQRIGLARAFLSNGDILILDEPTSNLDTLNEKEILKAVKENADKKTIILITHRKSTASICERTFKLENKKLEAF